MRSIKNPPSAQNLMAGARSLGNYDLASALADLIDNSIVAKAQEIDISWSVSECNNVKVTITDNGSGMSELELIEAMKPASSNPNFPRDPSDLGRFGWGLKSASFSQASILTVVTNDGAKSSAARWNLRDIDEFEMALLDNEDLQDDWLNTKGTKVIWTDCDRLTEDFATDLNVLNEIFQQARFELGLTFHRLLESRRLSIKFQGLEIESRDPFYKGTALGPKEKIQYQGSDIFWQSYTLPHFGKMSSNDEYITSGDEGTSKNQGFYIYRGDRLIIYGTWFKLIPHSATRQLSRIKLDIPNSLDKYWKVTIDKKDAQMPSDLRSMFRRIAKKSSETSRKVIQNKGSKIIERPLIEPVWVRLKSSSGSRFVLNQEHPIVKSAIESPTNLSFKSLIALINESLPNEFVEAQRMRASNSVQSSVNREEYKLWFNIMVDTLLENGTETSQLKDIIHSSEPFVSHLQLSEEILTTRGII